jgi:hypothetical protein
VIFAIVVFFLELDAMHALRRGWSSSASATRKPIGRPADAGAHARARAIRRRMLRD